MLTKMSRLRPIRNISLPASSIPDSSETRLLLPPPFRAFHAGAGDILQQAQAQVDQGAGTILWKNADGVLSLAVILEPGPPLVSRAADVDLGYVSALAALCDSLTHHGQPERRLVLHWPDRIFYDEAMLAGARWRVGPKGADGLPEWVIFAAEIIAARDGLDEPGLYPGSTSLAEEEFPEPAPMIESFASYLKLVIDRWSHEGPEAVLRRVLDRVHQHDALAGARIVDGRLQLPPLDSVLDETAWRDPARQGPAW